MGDKQYPALELRAARCRSKILRMIEAGGTGHIGGSFSCMDVVSALYFHKMRYDVKHPQWEKRDRFLISAGHKCMSLYAVLCEAGFFDEALLDTYGSNASKLPGHPNMYYLPGVEANTGALGHGLAMACGMALGVRLDGHDSKVYVVMGDGELAEGSNWEAAAIASHYKLDNLVLVVDNNELQINGYCRDLMSFEPIARRFASFGWATADVDGHDMTQIVSALDSLPLEKGKPSLIVAHTVKGKGYSVAEGNAPYHYWSATKEGLAQAKAENENVIKGLQGYED